MRISGKLFEEFNSNSMLESFREKGSKSKKFSLYSVTSEMEKHLRTANGLIQYLEFLRNFNKSFRTFKALTNNLPRKSTNA
jgi:hypothetical protein